jgi:hypothetical protein
MASRRGFGGCLIDLTGYNLEEVHTLEEEVLDVRSRELDGM